MSFHVAAAPNAKTFTQEPVRDDGLDGRWMNAK